MNAEGGGRFPDDLLKSLTDASQTDHREGLAGTITGLLDRVRAGDPNAEDQLYRAVIDQLVQKAARILRWYRVPQKLLEPEDLVGEVFQNLRRVLASHDVANRQHFFRIACRNFRWKILEILERVRRKGLELADEILPEPAANETSIPARAANAEAMECLMREIGELDEEQQLVIEYHIFLDMSFRQIADLLDCPHTSVSYSYHQTVKKLPNRLTRP